MPFKKHFKKNFKNKNQSGEGAIYCIGGVGALVFFLQNAQGAKEIIIALLKTIVWPAFLIYEAFNYLNV